LLDGLRRIEAARHEHRPHEARREPEVHASRPIADQTVPTGSAKTPRVA
jgi:hypothetical protein